MHLNNLPHVLSQELVFRQKNASIKLMITKKVLILLIIIIIITVIMSSSNEDEFNFCMTLFQNQLNVNLC